MWKEKEKWTNAENDFSFLRSDDDVHTDRRLTVQQTSFEIVDHKAVFVWIPSLAPQITLKSLN